jgi:hypothetical protein
MLLSPATVGGDGMPTGEKEEGESERIEKDRGRGGGAKQWYFLLSTLTKSFTSCNQMLCFSLLLLLVEMVCQQERRDEGRRARE